MTSIPTLLTSWRSAGWLLGLPVLAALWVGTVDLASRRIAATFAAGTSAVVRDTAGSLPEPWLQLETRGRDIVVSGEAPDADGRAQALARLRATPGLRRLVDRTGLIEEVSPFVWRIERTGPDRIETSGHRPAEIGAAALTRLASDASRGAHLRDRAKAAKGAPPDFQSAAAYAAERLEDLTTGSVATVSDTVVSVRGEAVSAAAYDHLRTALAAPPEGFSVGTVEVLPPAVADYGYRVRRRPDGGVALSGFAESEAAHAALRAAAVGLADGAAVEDGLRVARGLPAGVDPAALARIVFRLAALLREGDVGFERGSLSVSGTALDAPAVGEVEAMIRDERPARVAAGPVSLTAQPVSPYRVRIRREPDHVTLTGHLPDAATRAALLAQLRTRFFQEVIQDRTRLSAGAPDNLAGALKVLVDPLASLASGEAVLMDRTASLSGRSLYTQAAARLAAALPPAMPAGWTVSVGVEAENAPERLDPSTCQRRMAQQVARAPLRFAPGSSALRAEFYPILDAVAALARTCPGERVEVTGHLDPPGATPPPVAETAAETPAANALDHGKAEAATKSGTKVTSTKAEPAKTKLAKDESAKAVAAKTVAAKAVAAKTGPAKAGSAKSETSEAKPSPEPEPDLPQQRALAIVDYLQKAGVAPERALASSAPPQNAGDGVGLALRL